MNRLPTVSAPGRMRKPEENLHPAKPRPGKPALIPLPAGCSSEEIQRRFASEDKAREYLEAIRWPQGPVCAHCQNADAGRIWKIEANPKKKIRPGLHHCAECDRQFTVTVGTIFEDSKIPLNKWLVACYLECNSPKGVSALHVQRSLEFGSYRTAWRLMRRIRQVRQIPFFAGRAGRMGRPGFDDTLRLAVRLQRNRLPVVPAETASPARPRTHDSGLILQLAWE